MIYSTWNAPKDTFGNAGSVLYGSKGTPTCSSPITSNYKF